ncbi:MAG TPA: SAM-dependent methyltransferase [Streptosporangiaceae bacterium]|nr:SAM-dependent methyltransferase [Streptosporangiaceae bacterium]
MIPKGFDPNVPNIARIYDYMLGGKDNFAADRTAAEQIAAAFPESPEGVRHNRIFLRQTVSYLAGQAGVRQFLDLGAGLPTQQNVHEVAQATAPDARVVYVDSDPVVCVHGRALLSGTDGVAMVEADLREPEKLLADPAIGELIDFSRPTALMLVAVLHFIGDEAYDIVATLRDALAPGSYLVISHMLDVEERKEDGSQVKEVYSRASSGLMPRTMDEIMRFFDGLELLDNDLFLPPELFERFAGLGWGAVGRKA